VNYYSTDPTAYSFETQLEQVLDDAVEIGLPYVGTASAPGARYGETVDGYRRAAEDFNGYGAAARERGLRFYQHNHSGEFAVENGTRLYDVVLEETDPRLVFFELDIFWAYVGQSRYPASSRTSTRGTCRAGSRSSTSRTASTTATCRRQWASSSTGT